MSAFTASFLGLLAFTLVMQQWLGRRQINHVQAHRNSVPAAFARNITLAAHQNAADYSIAKSRLALAESISHAVILLLLTLGGVLQWLDSAFPGTSLLHGVLVILAAFAISSLADIPFDYYRTFTIDQRFGFNKMTPAMFFQDMVKHALVGLAMGLPLLFAALWLMQGAGTYWWLWLWCV